MQLTDILTLCVGSTGVKENRGPTCHICVLPADAWLPSSSVSPDSSHAAAAPQQPPRRLPVAPPPFFHTAAVHPRCHRRRAPAPFSHASRTDVPCAPPAQPFCAACSRHHRRLRLTPPPPLSSQPTQPRRLSHTPCSPRSRAAFTFHAAAAPDQRSPGARQIACSRWVARREREKKLWSRSPLASGLVQRRRPRGPRWWPRPPRSRHQAVLVRSRSGRTPEAEAEAEAEAGVWAE